TTAVLNFYEAGDHLDSTTLNTGTWYHVGYTHSAGNLLTFYVNGSATGTTYSSLSGGSITHFGNDSGDPLTGKLAEIASWSSVLASTDISHLANGSVDPLSLAPVVYWKLTEGSGTSVADTSGNANNG